MEEGRGVAKHSIDDMWTQFSNTACSSYCTTEIPLLSKYFLSGYFQANADVRIKPR